MRTSERRGFRETMRKMSGIHETAGRPRRMQAYLGRLPRAENSYPECRMRAGLVNISLDHRGPAPHGDWPDWLRIFVNERQPATAMVSYVKYNAWILAMLDSVWGGQMERFDAFNYEVNRKYSSHPMYRSLYQSASPSLLSRGLALALGQLMPGIRVEVDAGPSAATITLKYPPHLLNADLALGWAAALRATLANGGALEAQTECIETTATTSVFHARWAV